MYRIIYNLYIINQGSTLTCDSIYFNINQNIINYPNYSIILHVSGIREKPGNRKEMNKNEIIKYSKQSIMIIKQKERKQKYLLISYTICGKIQFVIGSLNLFKSASSAVLS